MNGYTGKILSVNLTTKSTRTIDTEQYEAYLGGHGLGSAIFWDLAVAPGQWDLKDGFDPKNVITIMSSPLTGTGVPSTARCEVQGVGPYAHPIEWFTRSNFGGSFSTMMKYAGWDGIVIEGKAEQPTWINIINDKVVFENAEDLWGVDTWRTQQEITRRITGTSRFGTKQLIDKSYTTQSPAILTIGPAGENLSRIATLQHSAGSAAGQGGFGGVWGAKNLKAISVMGTGSIQVADPKALLDARLWFAELYQYDVDDPILSWMTGKSNISGSITKEPGGWGFTKAGALLDEMRPSGCDGCPEPCRAKFASGSGNNSNCYATGAFPYLPMNEQKEITDTLQKMGINVIPFYYHYYFKALYQQGVLGKGKAIECDLPFDKYHTLQFEKALADAIAYRQKPFGDDIAEGYARAAEKWGRLKQDTDSGMLALPNWGYTEHYNPRAEVDWSYGSILGDRDINEHGLCWAVYYINLWSAVSKTDPIISAEDTVKILASKVVPFQGDPTMFDYSEGPTGIYSDSRAKTIAWLRRYSRSCAQSLLFCDRSWPNMVNFSAKDRSGATPEGEPKFFNAVTGKNIGFEGLMEAGRKTWNLDRAIWTMQGRHRDMEVHAEYVYTQPTPLKYILPAIEDGKWVYSNAKGRVLNKSRFEEWKTKYYTLEGWDPDTGWATRKTLEEVGLKHVADTLEKAGRLGSPA